MSKVYTIFFLPLITFEIGPFILSTFGQITIDNIDT